MSAAVKDGGPAFPSTEEHPSYDIPMHYHGMSLRDWFAGQALSGLLASETDGSTYTKGGAVERAYDFADAMIAEREKGGAK